MTELPRDPVEGQAITVTWAKQLLAYIRENTPRAGAGATESRTRNGVFIGVGSSPSASSSAPATLSAFDVRWYPHSDTDDTKGEWQIHLPFGCATIGERIYLPDKDVESAKDKDGVEIFGWYKIPSPKNEDGFQERADGWEAISWTVKVAFKAWPRLMPTTDTSEDGPSQFGRGYKEVAVATISVYNYDIDGRKYTAHKVNQLVSVAQKIERDIGGAFAIEYATDGSEYSREAKWTPRVRNQSCMLGRLQKYIDTPTDVGGWDDVCLKIEHSTNEYKVSLTKEFEESDAKKTVIRLYKMKHNEIVDDYREDISKIPFYN